MHRRPFARCTACCRGAAIGREGWPTCSQPGVGHLPRVVVGERRYLSHEEVHALATECAPYRLIVLFLAYTGVRFGELAALRVGKRHLLSPDSPAVI